MPPVRIKVIPTLHRTGGILPARQIAKALINTLPVGKRAAASFAFNVILDTARILMRLEVSEIILIDGPGDSQPNGAPARGNRFGPRGNIWPVIDRKAVAVGAGCNAIELDEVHAPGGKERDHGIDVLLGAGLREVDLVVIRIRRSACKSIPLRQRDGDDVLRVVLRTKNRIVAVDRRLLDTGNPVDAGR